MKGARLIQKDEIKKLLQTEDQREKMLILTGLYFGTRVSETVALRFGDFRGKYLHIISKKRSNDRSLVIPEEFRIQLNKLRKQYIAEGKTVTDDTPVFLSQKRTRKKAQRPITPEHANSILRRLRAEYGLDERVSCHSFRKTFITSIYKATGKDIIQTAIYSGHKSIDTLRAYIETSTETNLTTQLGWL